MKNTPLLFIGEANVHLATFVRLTVLPSHFREFIADFQHKKTLLGFLITKKCFDALLIDIFVLFIQKTNINKND